MVSLTPSSSLTTAQRCEQSSSVMSVSVFDWLNPAFALRQQVKDSSKTPSAGVAGEGNGWLLIVKLAALFLRCRGQWLTGEIQPVNA